MSRNKVAPADASHVNLDSTDEDEDGNGDGGSVGGPGGGLSHNGGTAVTDISVRELRRRERADKNQNKKKGNTSSSAKVVQQKGRVLESRLGRLSSHGITSSNQRAKRRARGGGGNVTPVVKVINIDDIDDDDEEESDGQVPSGGRSRDSARTALSRRHRAAASGGGGGGGSGVPGDAGKRLKDARRAGGGGGRDALDSSGESDGSIGSGGGGSGGGGRLSPTQPTSPNVAKESKKKRRLSKKDFGQRSIGWKGAVSNMLAWIKTEATRKRKNPLWARRIKVIEGRFGAGVASYFTFIRLVLEINVVLMLVTMFFVVIPFATHHTNDVQVIQFDPLYNANNTCQWYNGTYLQDAVAGGGAAGEAGVAADDERRRWQRSRKRKEDEPVDSEEDVAAEGGTNVTEVVACPSGLARGITDCVDGALLTNCSYAGTFKFLSVLNGDTSVGVSPMFFGGYPNKLYDATGETVVYQLDLAYVLTPMVLMISILLFLFFSMFRSWRNSGSSMVSSDNKMPFALFALASYDFSVNTEEGVENLRLGISRAMTEGLYDMYVNEDGAEAKKLSTKQLVARIIGWTLYFGIAVGSIFAIYSLVTWSNDRKKEAALDETQALKIWEEYALSAALATLNSMLPFVFKAFAYLEDYVNKATEIKIEIARTFIIRMIGIYAVLFGFISGGNTHMSEPHLPPFPLASSSNDSNPFSDPLPLYTMDQTFCVGTNIGQEFYKLVIVDMIFVVLSEMVLYFLIMWITKDTQDLDIAQAVIMICYRQGLIWVGMFFCPILAWIGSLAAFLSFYAYYLIVLKTCHPPKKSLGATSTRTVFLFFMTLTLLVTTAPLLYILRIYNPNCGPFAAPKYNSAFSGLDAWALENTEKYTQMSSFLEILQDPLVLWVLVLGQGIWINYTRENLSVAKFQKKDLQDEIAQVHAEAREMNAHLSDNGGADIDLDL